MSLPSRERGSKPDKCARPISDRQSLPSRERGSKHNDRVSFLPYRRVAPFTGAWIETNQRSAGLVDCEKSRSLHGSVDRNSALPDASSSWLSRSLHGSVDRNLGSLANADAEAEAARVAPFTGAWIETLLARRARASANGRSLHGSVDRNAASRLGLNWKTWSLPSRERGSKLHRRRRRQSRHPSRSLHGSVDRNFRPCGW